MKEFLSPLFFIPMFPFAILGGAVNRMLQPVPKNVVAPTKFIVAGFVLMLAMGFVWTGFAAFLTNRGILIGLLALWVGLGCVVVLGFVWSGNWQIKEEGRSRPPENNARDVT